MPLLNSLVRPGPPLSPMRFTRAPVMHRFWGGGLAALLLGFGLGLLVWLNKWDVIGELPWDYAELRLAHARLQLALFTGLFILGFAFQAGPHVLGSKPPPTEALLVMLFPLGFGALLTLTPDEGLRIAGQVLISIAYALGLKHMIWILQRAPADRVYGAGVPFFLGLLAFCVMPWIPLDEPAWGAAALLAGPVAIVLAAGQQLIANAMGAGIRFAGWQAKIFAALVLAAWVAAWAAAAEWIPWTLAAVLWLATAGSFTVMSKALQTIGKNGFTSLAFSIASALVWLFAALLWLLLDEPPLDAVAHMLALGVVTLLVLGVAARVASFFSAGYVMSETALVEFLILWQLVAAARVAAAAGWIDGGLVAVASLVGAVLLLVWIFRMGARLLRIKDLLPKPYQ